ncbi:MAG: winged helix-turn-helix transcriptional regulator [Bacteroidaceae bacterium]|nr:winged helix-turn-helix transcriptional regulator [Bacteroidaceae bacterium]
MSKIVARECQNITQSERRASLFALPNQSYVNEVNIEYKSICHAASLPMPTVENFCGGVRVTFQRGLDIVTGKKIVTTDVTDNGGNIGGKDGGDVPLNELTKIQKDIIDLIRADDSISVNQMAVKMAVKKRTLEREIANMKQKGYISRTGSPRNGQWEVVIPLDCIIEIA